jgi:hypothetical protein
MKSYLERSSIHTLRSHSSATQFCNVGVIPKADSFRRNTNQELDNTVLPAHTPHAARLEMIADTVHADLQIAPSTDLDEIQIPAQTDVAVSVRLLPASETIPATMQALVNHGSRSASS